MLSISHRIWIAGGAPRPEAMRTSKRTLLSRYSFIHTVLLIFFEFECCAFSEHDPPATDRRVATRLVGFSHSCVDLDHYALPVAAAGGRRSDVPAAGVRLSTLLSK